MTDEENYELAFSIKAMTGEIIDYMGKIKATLDRIDARFDVIDEWMKDRAADTPSPAVAAADDEAGPR
jgi:hypothetical protein